MSFRSIPLAFATFCALVCAGCDKPNPVDQNLRKLVVIQYAHVANVRQIRGSSGGNNVQIDPRKRNGFWAVFNLCSLDVQGADLPRFDYNAGNLYIHEGAAKFGAMNPGTVLMTSATYGALDSRVRTPVVQEVQVGQEIQAFPKALYPSLNYRVAIFVDGAPQEYRGGSMTLKYANHPVLLKDHSPRDPKDVPFIGPDRATNWPLPLGCE